MMEPTANPRSSNRSAVTVLHFVRNNNDAQVMQIGQKPSLNRSWPSTCLARNINAETPSAHLRTAMKIARGLSLCLLLAVAGCSRTASQTDEPPPPKPTGQTVQLVIDYEDGAEKHVTIPWQERMTVLDAMAKAKTHPHGFNYEQRYDGKNAMIIQIDDLVNQKGGEGARNWIYRVNGTLADRGCGEWLLRPDDVVLWKFGTYK